MSGPHKCFSVDSFLAVLLSSDDIKKKTFKCILIHVVYFKELCLLVIAFLNYFVIFPLAGVSVSLLTVNVRRASRTYKQLPNSKY
jgi:hypothetical protein